MAEAETPACIPRESLPAPVLEARGLSVSAGDERILQGVDLEVPEGVVYGLIGPSGAGKSTLLQCFNRLVDLAPKLRVEGEVRYRGESVRRADLPVDELRARVGMLFQQPAVFPGSILHNVTFGARRVRGLRRGALVEAAEAALREAALWDEVRDRLRAPASELSVGQQQRLCLARALACEPDVLLMDEPTSALDPRSTRAVEELILQQKGRRTVVLVTHDLAQARRVADWLACLCVEEGGGALLETACCAELLESPRCRAVAEFLATSGPREAATETPAG